MDTAPGAKAPKRLECEKWRRFSTAGEAAAAANNVARWKNLPPGAVTTCWCPAHDCYHYEHKIPRKPEGLARNA